MGKAIHLNTPEGVSPTQQGPTVAHFTPWHAAAVPVPRTAPAQLLANGAGGDLPKSLEEQDAS